MDAKQSWVTALTYVLQSFGVDGSGDTSFPELVVIDQGGYGTYPYKDHSVVQFDNGFWHYADHPADRTIIDSTDGQSKSMQVYGTPVQWYSYAYDESKIPVKPNELMVYVENVVDGIAYRRLQDAPKKMYVRKPEGIQLIDFSTKVSTPREFLGVPDSGKKYGDDIRIMGTASYSIRGYPDEVFYVTLDDWGLFTSTGHVERMQGYLAGDLTDIQPPKEPPRPKVPEAIIAITKPPTSLASQSITLSDIRPASDVRIKLTESFERYPEAIEYVSEDNSTVMFYDLTGKGEPVALAITNSALIIGKVKHPTTGISMLREATTEKTGRWYAAPEDKLITLADAEALQTPTVAERMQRGVDPSTGKKTSGGRFSMAEWLTWIPLSWLTSWYITLDNKIKKRS